MARTPARARRASAPATAALDPGSRGARRAAPGPVGERSIDAIAAKVVWGTLSGATLTGSERRLVGSGLGGLVLFTRNVESPERLRTLIADVRAIGGSRIRIAVDQEGGHITRIGAPLTPFGPPMSLGAVDDEGLAYDVARASGRELRDLGIDVVLAPVLDVAADLGSAVVGARSFGDDPMMVGRLGAAMVRGYLDGGVLPMPKHFPGHGRTALDSHLTLPVVEGSRHDFDSVDVSPYRAAIAANAPALMTAHVVHRALADGKPASLSERTTRIARDELGFSGLLVTDAVVMDAVARGSSPEQAAVDAIAAGADVVMALEAARRCIAAIAAGIERGALDPARLDEAISRIDAFGAAGTLRTEPATADSTGHAALAARLARRSLTLVAGNGLVPVRPNVRLLVVDVRSARVSPVEDAPGAQALGRIFATRFAATTTIVVNPADPGAWDRAHAAAPDAERIVLATRDVFATEAGRLGVARFADVPAIRVALRSPADLDLPGPGARIAAYADTPPVAIALADALLAGPSAFRGALPVRLSGASDTETAA